MKLYNTLYQSIALSTLLFASTNASAGVVYSNDFDGNVFEATAVSSTLTGGSIEGVQGFDALGFNGNFLRNSSLGNPATSTTFTLTGLDNHTSISIKGLLAVIDSWDSSEDSCCSPDLLGVKVDGTLVTSATFNNAIGNTNTLFGASLTGGSRVANTYDDYGFSDRWKDQAFDFSGYAPLTDIAHTASTLTVEFFAYGAGWQGGADESYALENISISTNGVSVSEPSTFAIFALGALGLAARRFKSTHINLIK